MSKKQHSLAPQILQIKKNAIEKRKIVPRAHAKEELD